MFSEVLQIVPNAFELAVLWAFCIYVIWSGRPELALGVYLSAQLWTRPIVVGTISATWVLLTATAVAALVYFHRDRGLGLSPYTITQRGEQWVPPVGRWVIGWMLLWLIWMVTLAVNYRVELEGLFRGYLLTILVPMVVGVLFAGDMRRLRRFAWAFVAMTLIACWKAIEALGLPLDYLIQDPGLSNTTYVRLGLRNYHFFSHMLGIALILAVALLLRTRRLVESALLLAAAAIFAHFILLAGARQTMSGAVVVLALMVLWALRRRGLVKARALTVLYVALFVGVSIFQVAPNLVLREGEDGVSDSFNIFDDRGGYWVDAVSSWLQSPIWGTGFENTGYAHNLFIGALADQGLIGLLFFVGWLAFALVQGLAILRGEGSDEGQIWRVGLFGIFLFGMIHGQASGSVLVTAHIYWPIVLLWVLNWRDSAARPALPEERPAAAHRLPLATRWLAPRRS